jgi:hypothetical protein
MPQSAAPQSTAPQSAPVDGPTARFDDDFISKLEGRWKLTRAIRGTEVKNTLEARWVLNHQFLQIHMIDAATPPAYEAIVMIGIIHATGEYVAHWCDTFGGKFSALGKGTRRGDSIEFKFEYSDGPFFNTFTWHPERQQWTMRGENQDSSGARKLFATDTLVKE